MLPPEIFHEYSAKLFFEFYPDLRQCVADIAKDITNQIPENPELDGVLSCVMISCLAKEMALILAPYPEEEVHTMIHRIMLCVQHWVPEMRQELKDFLASDRHGTE